MALKGSIGPSADRPTVSVIVPARNAAGTIERAIESSLAGAGQELECVVVDDASTDATAAVVERLAAADARIRLLRAGMHDGVSAARNRALGAAAGTWLTFLDADDRLLPGGLAAMLAAGVRRDALAVVGHRIWTDGRWTWRTSAYAIPDIRRPGRTSLAARPGLVYYASATGKLFHRSLLDGLAFEGRVLGDQPWTLRALIRAGDRIEVIADDVYEWSRPRRGTASSSITEAKRGSARLAAEAARVAVGALADVAVEAAAHIADPVACQRLVATYVERLVRSDLAGPVRRAVARRDEGTDELFGAIEAFLAAAPPAAWAEGSVRDAVAREILRPPLEGWARLTELDRVAYVRLLRAGLAQDAEVSARVTSGTWLGPGLRVLLEDGVDPSSPAVLRALARQRPLAALGDAVRLGRRGLSRLRTLRPAGRPARR